MQPQIILTNNTASPISFGTITMAGAGDGGILGVGDTKTVLNSFYEFWRNDTGSAYDELYPYLVSGDISIRVDDYNVPQTLVSEQFKAPRTRFQTYATAVTVRSVDDLLLLYGADAITKEITLPSGIYYIDAFDLDLGDYTLVANGDIHIFGLSQLLTRISSKKVGAVLLKTNNANVFLTNIEVSCTGAGSRAFELTDTVGDKSLDMDYVSFGAGTDWGIISGFRQGYMGQCFAVGSTKGFTLKGTWTGGFTIFNSRFINVSQYVLGGDVGFTCNAIRSNMNVTIPALSVATDFDYNMFNNDGGYQFDGGRFDGVGKMVSDFTTGDTTTAYKSSRSLFRDNTGSLAVNTRIGGNWLLLSTQLTPLTVNVPAKLLGNTQYNNLQHFTQTSSNAFTYTSTEVLDFIIDARLTIDGGANDEIEVIVRKWDNSALAYVDIVAIPATISNILGGRDIAVVNFKAEIEDLDIDDRIELWVVNTSDSTDVTMLQPSTVFLNAI